MRTTVKRIFVIDPRDALALASDVRVCHVARTCMVILRLLLLPARVRASYRHAFDCALRPVRSFIARVAS